MIAQTKILLRKRFTFIENTSCKIFERAKWKWLLSFSYPRLREIWKVTRFEPTDPEILFRSYTEKRLQIPILLINSSQIKELQITSTLDIENRGKS